MIGLLLIATGGAMYLGARSSTEEFGRVIDDADRGVPSAGILSGVGITVAAIGVATLVWQVIA